MEVFGFVLLAIASIGGGLLGAAFIVRYWRSR